MKLSEAIRLGAMMREQGFFSLFDGGRSCALGAAMEAFGIDCGADSLKAARLLTHFYDTLTILTHRVTLPCCCNPNVREARVSTVIQHMNDSHKLTREQIADWVETIEAQHAPKPTPELAEARR